MNSDQRMNLRTVFFIVLGVFFSSHLCAQTKMLQRVPARASDGKNPELFVMTLGDVKTPLATAIFDMAKDELRFNNGRVLRNYYRDSLKVKFYKAIDKSVFSLPPSGWCSWYYYYQEINEEEIGRNAEWISRNLKEYGAEVVQIDDGWQGTGHGLGENRDWSTIDSRFSAGMDKLAATIRGYGLKAGIWLAPHGQSNESLVKGSEGAFLLDEDGKSVSKTWEGLYLLDPSTESGHRYLKDLFTTLSLWGYDYFKIDGQPIVVDEYRKHLKSMKNPTSDYLTLYRSTLSTIRTTIGPNRYLLGCWGIPEEGVSIMNGSRTGGDVILGWDGFLEAVRATMSNYYLHNIVWYCDPDVMLLRTPLTLDQARAWATLQGLTGQALMASDRMPDLSEERVEILKRVFPALDIRPLDLFPSTINKKIWDLKISHLGRNYDVVGVFNFKQDNRENVLLKWSDLGLPENVPVHIFDFWNDEYLGAWESGIHLELSPTSCRVLTLIPDDGRIQLISTSRHIAQGTVDLLALTLDQKNLRCQGISKVIAGDRYELRFAYPRSQNYVISKATAGGLPVTITNHQGWGTVQFVSPASAEVSWQLTFESADRYHYPVNKVTNLSVGLKNLDGAELSWSSNYNLNAGYQVYVDNQLQGYTPVPRFPLAGLDPQKIYEVSVTTVWDNGMINESKRSMPLLISSLLPQQIDLSGITPNRATSGWGNIRSNVSVTGQPLTVDGDRFDRGIGTHADSDLEFPVNGLFGRFTAKVGIDDDVAEKKGSVEFSIVGDGKLLWKSEKMEKGDSPESIEVDISKVITLVLRVTSTGDGIDYDHADWLEPTLHRK